MGFRRRRWRLGRARVAEAMCPSEDKSYCTAAKGHSRTDSLYDRAGDSDVRFLVGPSEPWLIPGHKTILSDANPVFRAQFEGPLAQSTASEIIIEDVDPRAFEHFLRHLYGKDIKFQSVQTALGTLAVANKYLCPDLIEICVRYLDENLTVKDVLYVYTNIKLLATEGAPCLPFAPPSAPYEDTASVRSGDASSLVRHRNNTSSPGHPGGRSRQETPLSHWINILLHNCLQFIDENAEEVLQHEDVEILDRESFESVVTRDTLLVGSEATVFLAVERWAKCECKKRKLQPSRDNCRLLLGGLIFKVRYGAITAEEFLQFVIPSDLLETTEIRALSRLTAAPVPGWLEPHLCLMRTRRAFVRNDSIALSQRTYLIETEKRRNSDAASVDLLKKHKSKKKSTKEKSAKEARSMSIDSTKSEKKCSSCFTGYVIDFISCIFD